MPAYCLVCENRVLGFGSFVTRGCVWLWTQFTVADKGGCPHSLCCSELVAEFEANVNGGLIGADAAGEEVLVHLGGQVAVDLVGDGVVSLHGAAELGRGLELGFLGSLEVAASRALDGVVHESLEVDRGAVLLTGEVCGDLGEVLPVLVVHLPAEGDLVVLALGEIGSDGGPHLGVRADVVDSEGLDLVALLEHFSASTGLPVVTLQHDASLDVEGLVLSGLVGHVNLVLDKCVESTQISGLSLFAGVEDVLVVLGSPRVLDGHVGLAVVMFEVASN